MPTQKRETGKNYIDIVSDAIEAQCAAEVRSASDRRMSEYFAGLVAAILKRRGGPAQ